MKILFICGSLEPGHDGVGDYTRRLAVELIQQGQIVAVLAIKDNHINHEFDGFQSFDGNQISVLRIPSHLTKEHRYSRGKEWINLFDPEWISLQFVLFSFNSKGLPFRLNKYLFEIGKGRQWHIMFHELWVGMEREAPIKYVLLGNIQKIIIKSILKTLKPSVIHTQTTLYQSHLLAFGIKASILPLFSNIPSEKKGILHTNIKDLTSLQKKIIRFVIFGGIHPGAPFNEFIKEVKNYSEENGIIFTLSFVGRCGTEQEKWIGAWISEGMMAEKLGEQSAESISHILKKSTLGIATTPYALIEKSGSVAAMLEHGLPVICVSKYWLPRNNFQYRGSKGISLYRKGNLDSCIKHKNVLPRRDISEIAGLFVKDLKTATF